MFITRYTVRKQVWIGILVVHWLLVLCLRYRQTNSIDMRPILLIKILTNELLVLYNLVAPYTLIVIMSDVVPWLWHDCTCSTCAPSAWPFNAKLVAVAFVVRPRLISDCMSITRGIVWLFKVGLVLDVTLQVISNWTRSTTRMIAWPPRAKLLAVARPLTCVALRRKQDLNSSCF